MEGGRIRSKREGEEKEVGEKRKEVKKEEHKEEGELEK